MTNQSPVYWLFVAIAWSFVIGSIAYMVRVYIQMFKSTNKKK